LSVKICYYNIIFIMILEGCRNMSKYAEVINKAIIKLENGEEARAEQLFVKSSKQEEIRFSWWTQDGHQFQRAPLDLSENDWLRLFQEAVKDNIFSPDFKDSLIKILSK
jgi:hypothetical protein